MVNGGFRTAMTHLKELEVCTKSCVLSARSERESASLYSLDYIVINFSKLTEDIMRLWCQWSLERV